MNEIGKLYIVATPIGNLEDITLRALRTLKEVDVIACEDTRVTSKLLGYYNISKSLFAFHHHTKDERMETLLEKILAGQNVALVTDAGTPGVSDPGNKLVQEALQKEIEVVPIPGASAVATLISVAGIDMQQFLFLGFPPHKKGRETFFKKVVASEVPVMYYESPHRVLKNFELLQTLLLGINSNEKSRNIIVGRELTKMFEQVVRGSVAEILAYFMTNPGKVKGEFVVIVN